jgi:CubicO group peptidase (beta-lactamase class C family)
MSAARLKEATDYIMETTGTEEDRKGVRTDGYVIVKDGYLVAEGYARGYTQGMRHLAWSMSKSFVNALYGIAVANGEIDIHQPASKYYPPLDTDTHRDITVEQLLHMSSGIDWNEGYEASPLKSSVLAMLYTVGRKDMALFTATRPIRYPPDQHWCYSSGTSNLLMGILRHVVGETRYVSYPWKELFDKIGMQDVVWERDASGNFVGSSYLYATPREMAKFGYLFLRNGKWEDQQLLADGWVDFSTTLAPAYAADPPEHKRTELRPGAHWWLNVGIPDKNFPVPCPSAPSDTFAAVGHWGQTIFVIPSLDLVIVRTADDRDGTFDKNRWVGAIVSSIEK